MADVPSQFWGVETQWVADVTRVSGTEMKQFRLAAESAAVGALQGLGPGVVPLPDEDSFKVTAGIGLKALVGAGVVNVLSSTYGAVILQSNVEVELDVEPSTTTYIHVGILDNVTQSQQERGPNLLLSESESVADAELLAEVTTDATSIVSLVDRRRFLQLVPDLLRDAGTWNATTTYRARAVVKHASSYWIALQENTNSEPEDGSADWDTLGSSVGGTTWRDGDGVPDNSLGVDGDYYLDNETGNYYKRNDGAYELRGNLTGPQGATGTAGTTWFGGSGAPSNATGADNDWYYDVATGDVYRKASGVWGLQFNTRGPQGVPGQDGTNGLSLNWIETGWEDATAYAENDALPHGDPASSYRCHTAHTSSIDDEPGVGTNWEDYWHYVAEAGADGEPGNTTYGKNGAPTSGEYNDGDWVWDYANGRLYEKVAGTWELRISLPVGANYVPRNLGTTFGSILRTSTMPDGGGTPTGDGFTVRWMDHWNPGEDMVPNGSFPECSEPNDCEVLELLFGDSNNAIPSTGWALSFVGPDGLRLPGAYMIGNRVFRLWAGPLGIGSRTDQDYDLLRVYRSGTDYPGLRWNETTDKIEFSHDGLVWEELGSGGSGESTAKSFTQAAHGFAVGDAVFHNGTAWAKAQSDSDATADVAGVVSEVADADNFTVTFSGYISGLSGLTPGAVYYLSPTTAGALTATEPSTAGHISKPVLQALSATEGVVLVQRGIELGEATELATVATTGSYNDLVDKPTLGDAAALDVGTTAGTVAAGDHTHASNAAAVRQALQIPGGKRYYSQWFDFDNGTTGTPFSSVSANGGVTGTGNLTDGRIGILAAQTGGTSASGRIALTTGSNTLCLGSGEARFSAALKISSLSTVSEEYAVRIGFMDSATGEAVDGVYFEYDRASHGDFWALVTASNSTRTKTISAIAVTTSWVSLDIAVNAAGTQVDFYVDGVLAGSNTTFIPTSAARQTGVGFSLIKSAGTAARAIDFDYIGWGIDLTSSR